MKLEKTRYLGAEKGVESRLLLGQITQAVQALEGL